MFESKISKEKINSMPIESFQGEIKIIDTAKKISTAIKHLSEQTVIGIDTETKPSFKRGVIHKISLLQIATTDVCYLFRLNKIGFPAELSALLADKNIVKIGLALRDDLNGLAKQDTFKPANFIDLQNIVREYGILELSLQKIYAILFGKKISKSQRLTNWENEELTDLQKKYAATDAWATLLIYLKLQKEEKISAEELDRLINEHTTQTTNNTIKK